MDPGPFTNYYKCDKKLLQSVIVICKVRQLLQSVAGSYDNVWQILQSVTRSYYKVCYVSQSVTVITMWDLTSAQLFMIEVQVTATRQKVW